MKEKLVNIIGNVKATIQLLPLSFKMFILAIVALQLFFTLNLTTVAYSDVPSGDVERHLHMDGSASTLVVKHRWILPNQYVETHTGIFGSSTKNISKGEYKTARISIGL